MWGLTAPAPDGDGPEHGLRLGFRSVAVVDHGVMVELGSVGGMPQYMSFLLNESLLCYVLGFPKFGNRVKFWIG